MSTVAGPRTALRRRRRVLGVVVGAALLVVAASCGIPAERDANRIAPADVPFGLLDEETTTTAVAEGRATSVYLLTKDRLAAVDRSLPDDADLADLLELVVAGPTKVERRLGLTSAVPSGTVATVKTSRGIAKVDLNAAFGDIRSSDQLLALGQIVYSLTGQPGIGAVSFSLEGKPVEVPLGDGTTSAEPLSRDDFAALAPA